MTAVGMNLGPVVLETQLMGMVSGNLSAGINNTVSTLLKGDNLTTANLSNGPIPAVRSGLVSRLNNSTTNFFQGARNVTSSAVNSTISAGREAGKVLANDILPKPEPLSTTFMRNKFISALLVGGLINGMKGISKVIKGDDNPDQILPTVVKDTTLGAIGGLSFAGGMGATASMFGKMMGKVPLSIVGLTFGTLAAVGVTELLKATVPAFED